MATRVLSDALPARTLVLVPVTACRSMHLPGQSEGTSRGHIMDDQGVGGLVKPQERSRQSGQHLLPSLQSMSGLQSSMLVPDESKGLSQLCRTPGPALTIPPESGLPLETRPGQQTSLQDSIPGKGPWTHNVPETGKLREHTGSGCTEGMRRRNGSPGQEGQGSLSRGEINTGGLVSQLPTPRARAGRGFLVAFNSGDRR